jgi:hypothetical protein
MAKKKSTRRKATSPSPTPTRPAVTAERFARLYRLVNLLATGERTRDQLAKQLGLDVRGFYRDLETLRGVTITVKFVEGHYSLGQPADDAIAKLPFPDPHLSLGEVRQLAKGRSRLHTALQGQIETLLA